MQANRRVLVTGINGFTGPYLAAQLEKDGYEAVSLPELDITSMGSIQQLDGLDFEYVVHLAAISRATEDDTTLMHTVNVDGTRNLLSYLNSTGAGYRKILLASSAHIYGEQHGDNAIAMTEATVPHPVNDYAHSKLAMEGLMSTFPALPVSVVRPFNYTGIGQEEDMVVPKLIGAFSRRDETLPLGNIDSVRSFSDVRLVAAAYSGLLEHAQPGEAYNICGSESRSVRDVINSLQELTGHSPQILADKRFMRKNPIPVLTGSNEKLVKTIGKLPFDDFDATLKWMLDQWTS